MSEKGEDESGGEVCALVVGRSWSRGIGHGENSCRTVGFVLLCWVEIPFDITCNKSALVDKIVRLSKREICGFANQTKEHAVTLFVPLSSEALVLPRGKFYFGGAWRWWTHGVCERIRDPGRARAPLDENE